MTGHREGLILSLLLLINATTNSPGRTSASKTLLSLFFFFFLHIQFKIICALSSEVKVRHQANFLLYWTIKSAALCIHCWCCIKVAAHLSSLQLTLNLFDFEPEILHIHVARLQSEAFEEPIGVIFVVTNAGSDYCQTSFTTTEEYQD